MVEEIHALYTSSVELSSALDLHLPLGEKSIEQISIILKEYNDIMIIFRATCVSQIKINHLD